MMSFDYTEIIGFLFIASLLVGLFYLPSIKTGLNLGDEGYLWYGTLKVLEGKIPIRDFRAYDPGRYYWCALWMHLLGQTLLSLRIALVSAQILALAIGLSVIYTVTGAWSSVILMGLAMIAWMYPRHKQIDVLFIMMTPLVAVLLVYNPVADQFFGSGVYVSICLFFGLNHGLYAGAGLSLLTLLLGFKGIGLDLTESGLEYAIGLAVGVLPILALFIFVPGLFRVYWQQKISRIIKRGSANLPLQIPWLWQTEPAQLKQFNKFTQWFVKALFTLIPIVYVAIILPVLVYTPTTNQQWAMIAIACCGFCYWHHALSRADLSHLNQSIAPFIMLVVIFSIQFSYGWIAVLALTGISIKYIYFASENKIQHIPGSTDWVKYEIEGHAFYIDSGQHRYLQQISQLIEAYSRKGDSVLLLPTLVILYPLLQRHAGVYNIFSVYPATTAEQSQMIKKLTSHLITFALINNAMLDGRKDLRFSQTHPQVWQHLHDEFQLLDGSEIPNEHYAFIKH